jgi:hypothetical protein
MFKPNKGDRPDIPDLMFVITDGKSIDKEDTLLQAKNAKERGIR